MPLRNNKKNERGPFDIIGDIHGCYDELCALLEKLGWEVNKAACTAEPPAGRKAVFLGDFCDRGPRNVAVLRLAMNLVESGAALAVVGNHDEKFVKYLRGKTAARGHMENTIAELEQKTPEFRRKVFDFFSGLVSHYILDNGSLVVAHAGIKEKLQGRASGAVRAFCLFGETTGEIDEFGLPVRLPWAEAYQGKAFVVYGHTPAPAPVFLNNTVCIDTGCVFGGALSAFRWPEREIVAVPALRHYYAPFKPSAGLSGGRFQHGADAAHAC
jgi:protein phosphatase